MTFYSAIAVQAAFLALVLALPALGQEPRPSCTEHVAALETALEAEGARKAVFDEHLALLRESERRGEETLCRDLADSLRAKLEVADV